MNVLIVESAAKGRTLQRYLGDGWKVLATGGHVETLPYDRARHGKEATKAFWANRPGELPTPPWVWTERGEAAVQAILDEAGTEPTFWIATDPDREGEFIAWSLERRLQAHGPTHRVSFQEVTDEAVNAALEHPRAVDARMVDSALVRKFLDRLVGFRASKMASTIVGQGASMGRVQTPTLGFVVERELEREAHVPIRYFEVKALAAGVDLKVRFHEPGDADAWRDEAGRADPSRTFERGLAEGADEALRASGRVTLDRVKEGSRERKPETPFSTDALLQATGSRFGWSPGKTSVLASMLYEAGHITYIRTDSTRLAASAVEKARAVVSDAFGEDHLGTGARAKAATGPTQDAHEAIRPTRLEVDEPPLDDADARKLYRLIRAHTLASQMAPSKRTVVRVEARCAGLDRPLTGRVSWRTFAGWEAAYAEFLTAPPTAPPAISLTEGAIWPLDPATAERDNPLLVEDETRPPSRYRPHTLIKAMKDAGIGRPSTYARTVEKLEDRGYVELEEGALVPTTRGRNVWIRAAPLYAHEASPEHEAAELFSPEFTALMEERLDRIAEGEAEAPTTWDAWRDQIRDLHAAAQDARKAGRSTLKQHEQLARLLVNAPADTIAASGVSADDDDAIAELSWHDAQNLIGKLREAGVRPAPTGAQMAYLERLATDLGLDEPELEEITGVADLTAITDSVQASAAIDALQSVYDERRPASARQRRFIDSLLDDAGLGADEAAALVGAASLDELTGGPDGTASALIDALRERLEGATSG
jgi:DNA topoisomerase-1